MTLYTERMCFDFGEGIDRSKYCRWHFCNIERTYPFGFLNRRTEIDIYIWLN